MLVKHFSLLIFFLISVQTQPIIIKSGIAKDHLQHEDGGIFDLTAKKGISSYESDQGFNKDKEGKSVSAQDSGKYMQQLADNKHHVKESDYKNENFAKQGGGLIENIGKQAGHKKGHQKSGFKNSYHKEETGSKSSYYDDSDDQGGQYLLNSKQGVYSDDSSNKNRGSYLDGSKYINDDSRQGYYNNEGLYNKNLGGQQNYNQEKYQDDRALQGQSNTGNRFGESGTYLANNYHTPHHYGHDDYYPEDRYYGEYSTPRRVITVYEDPRVYESNSHYEQYPEYDRYEDHLQIRRPIAEPAEHRYYDHGDDIYRHGYY